MTYTCYYCKGDVVPRRIRHVHSWKGQVFIFDDVPADVCQQCGEVYFPPATAEMFDRIAYQGSKPTRTLSVPVFSLADITAG